MLEIYRTSFFTTENLCLENIAVYTGKNELITKLKHQKLGEPSTCKWCPWSVLGHMMMMTTYMTRMAVVPELTKSCGFFFVFKNRQAYQTP